MVLTAISLFQQLWTFIQEDCIFNAIMLCRRCRELVEADCDARGGCNGVKSSPIFTAAILTDNV